MNEITEQIKQKEEALGRSLTSIERLAMLGTMSSKDDSAERMEIILSETMEGIEALNDFHAEIDKANLVNNRQMRHVAAHQFEATKRELLQKFNKGEIERIKPAA